MTTGSNSHEPFFVYGSGREGNLRYKPPSRDGFLEDLATCRALMATTGFTLISQALHLHKPYLALPMIGRYDQEINAHFLSQLGYGIDLRSIRPEAVGDFFYRLPELTRRLAAYASKGNHAILERLAALTVNDCEQALEFRRQRKGVVS